MTTTPRTWVVGEVVTAALMNQEIRDQFNAMFGAWSTFTPTWTADAGTTTLGNGTLDGRYRKVGRTVDAAIRLVWGSTTSQSSSASNWRFALPPGAAPYAGKGSTWHTVYVYVINNTDSGGANSRWQGSAFLDPSGSTVYGITINADGGFMDNTSMPVQVASGGSTTLVQPGAESWAAADSINITCRYEAAT